MSAKPRDLLKSRQWRLGEALNHNALKTGQANSQVVLWGSAPAVGTPTTGFDVPAGEAVLAQALVTWAAVTANAVPAGAATAAGQFRKVLIERDATGAIFTVVGAVSTVDQPSAALPAGDPTKISVGWLELPAAFTPGTTALTAAMCKAMPYTG